jgi:hypothetical protein
MRDQKVLVRGVFDRERIQEIADIRADTEIREPANVDPNSHSALGVHYFLLPAIKRKAICQ